MASKVLLIEDDASFRKAVADVLSLEGYTVLQAPSGKAGILAAKKEMPDLVILDLIMPGIKGLEVCQFLKQDIQTARLPIIILTGNDKDGQDIACLDMGADDYLTKPVKSPRLLAYCRALLRRNAGEERTEPPARVDVGGLSLDYPRKVVKLGGKEFQHLTPKEFELLYFLAKRTPNPTERAEVYREVWGVEAPSDGALKTVEVHVRRVRLKLGWKSDQWLVSVSGRGYALIPPK
ncbi:MAG: DNA-binding response regulator [Elusimicrobia bacterium CG11_big_fil_rev_8_21_14_0_20_64_6]|nr:MAG: DNA-binding response regulator [Elusimicrobia bacterium CG11_big_fil_rev_8_21_14_0_20_64_6]